ncbi:hypothetical protein Cgig2_006562 [Carnegiea gigantea]|uniref:BED-type domain-containing protein n=1 Tax=Carnegiea gigantea TaxID=171969 RepID=A0A9Q1Q6J1_9CARY|nr:hypothetical protein Cgig2_006562 [Carnegiea gigantea]
MKLFTTHGGGPLWLNHHGRALFPFPNQPRTTVTNHENLIYDDEAAGEAGSYSDDGSDHGSTDDAEALPRARGGPRRPPSRPAAGPSHPSHPSPAGAMSPSVLQTVLDRLDQLHVQNQEILRNQQHMTHLVVAEVDSKEANRPTTIQIGVYKAQATADGIGKPPKCQRKLTSTVWEHYEFLPPDKEGNLFCKCKKSAQTYPGDSRYGTDNLKRHLGNCKRRNVRDIGQLLLESRSGSLGSRRPEFDSNEFHHLLATCLVKHELPFQFVEYDGVRDMLAYLNPMSKLCQVT